MSETVVRTFDYSDVPTLKAFSESSKAIRAICGPYGSGKSSGMIMDIIEKAKNQNPDSTGTRKTRWAVIRNKYPQLKDTTIKTFHHWVIPGPDYFGLYNKTDHAFYVKFPLEDRTLVDCEVLFRALDRPEHVSNLLSMELTGAWFNEIREIPKVLFDNMDGRVGRFPPENDGGCTWSGILADTNPCDTDHWFYRLFEEQLPNDPTIQEKYAIFHQPSGRSAQAENIKNLKKDYYKNLVIGKPIEWIKVYVDGEYGSTREDQPVYPNYCDSIHCAPLPLTPTRGLPLILGWDFGLNASCVMSQYKTNGQLQVIDEVVGERIGIKRLVRDVVKPILQTAYAGLSIISTGDRSGNRESDTDERSCLQELRAAGLPCIPSRTNAWLPRFTVVDEMLTRRITGDQPAFLLSPKCKILRKGFISGYKFKRMPIAGYDMYKEEPDDNIYTHPQDCIQYICLHIQRGINTQRSIYDSAGNFDRIKQTEPSMAAFY